MFMTLHHFISLFLESTSLILGTNGSELVYAMLQGESTAVFLTVSDWLENYGIFPTLSMIFKVIFLVMFISIRSTISYIYLVNV